MINENENNDKPIPGDNRGHIMGCPCPEGFDICSCDTHHGKSDNCLVCGAPWIAHEVLGEDGGRGHRINAPGRCQHGIFHWYNASSELRSALESIADKSSVSEYAEEILACDHLASAIHLEEEIRRDERKKLNELSRENVFRTLFPV